MLDNEKAARHKRICRVIMWVILLALFLCFIFPFVLVIINVFKTKADITSDPLALIGAHGFTLKNFPEAMKKMNFSRVFLNSAIITTSATVLTSRNEISAWPARLPGMPATGPFKMSTELACR